MWRIDHDYRCIFFIYQAVPTPVPESAPTVKQIIVEEEDWDPIRMKPIKRKRIETITVPETQHRHHHEYVMPYRCLDLPYNATTCLRRPGNGESADPEGTGGNAAAEAQGNLHRSLQTSWPVSATKLTSVISLRSAVQKNQHFGLSELFDGIILEQRVFQDSRIWFRIINLWAAYRR